jgi:hypothetical protein
MIVDGHEIPDELIKAKPPKRDYSLEIPERLEWARRYIVDAQISKQALKESLLPIGDWSALNLRCQESLKMADYYVKTAEHFWYLWRKYNLGHDIVLVTGD